MLRYLWARAQVVGVCGAWSMREVVKSLCKVGLASCSVTCKLGCCSNSVPCRMLEVDNPGLYLEVVCCGKRKRLGS
ncbi:hypothetical protein B0I37DRAFT_367364 [Chaetomium sp. MPI-CAGE-AT-0009]|nr:hypothetical protein B0I37DRAFT_367364 [Chaetomium sp. MPI-CAGE-AT-0009]